MTDHSSGFDEFKDAYISRRSAIGARQVRDWALGLGAGASVLDVGCGHGVPITAALLEAGCQVHAVDGSPRMVEAFRSRFPQVPVACEPVEHSALFNRTFNGVVAWGLVFLLEPRVQLDLLPRLARALAPRGQLLFTAPAQTCEWDDALTARGSRSLGQAAYRRAVEQAGLVMVSEFDDEGENHYFVAENQKSPEG